MPRKKKQTLYTSLSEQQQFLEKFYNDLNHGAFIGHKFGGEGKHESKTSCSSSDNDVDVSGKDTDCTSQPVDDKDFVPRNKMTWIITIFYHPKNLLLFIILTQQDNL